MTEAPKLSLCIVSHAAYGAIVGGRSGHIGGVEWQTTLTARWFAQKGYPVTMVTWDEGGPTEEFIEGVRIIKLCKRDAGLRGLRFFHPRWTSLNAALRKADADVYYHNCGEAVTGQIALWCKRHARGFVFSTANDTDCDTALPELRTAHERILYRLGLRHASHVIVQTEKQREMLKSGFRCSASVIPMPCPGPANDEITIPLGPRSQRVLWIARVTRQKRPDRLVEVARACPELHFDLVGPSAADEYANAVLSEAQDLPNVTIHGAVPRDQVARFYQQAGCLCCTSDYEGFPNTFLEAWSYGVPIVSMFDPDGLIAREHLGMVAADAAGVVRGLRRIFASGALHHASALNARRYYAGRHTVDKVLPLFAHAFESSRRCHMNEKNTGAVPLATSEV